MVKKLESTENLITQSNLKNSLIKIERLTNSKRIIIKNIN